MRLNAEQRKLIADKLRDLANLSIAGLVFGNFLSQSGFHPNLMISGLLFYLGLMVGAIRLRE